jgi:di/tricarboxylate transporter
MLTHDIIIVIAVILFVIVSLYKEIVRPVATFVIAVLVLNLFGIIKSSDLLAGFANEQLAIIFLLLILSDIIKKTGILNGIIHKIFNPSISYQGFLGRLMLMAGSHSVWINNTPLVAIMIPQVISWAKKKGISPSKVLIPLSYATILGGTATLVGTSTNLVVNGLAVNAGLPSLKMFDFTYVGIPLIILGYLYMALIGHKLLPSRKDPLAQFQEQSREYLIETVANPNSALIGQTVDAANLRNLRGLFLVEIVRQNKQIVPVSPDEIIQANDILIFAGATDTIIDLIKDPKGLSLPSQGSIQGQDKVEIVEVVISAQSALNNTIVKEISFRGNYDAAIVAINRNGERLSGKIGEVELKSGDLLLLAAGKDFKNRSAVSQDFYVISNLDQIQKVNPYVAWFIMLGTISTFFLAGREILPLFTGLLILITIIVGMKVARFGEIKRAMDIDLFAILALSLAVGKAISNSGADKYFASHIISAIEPFHSKVALLFGIYIITNVLAMVVTNKAAVAITFPIALSMTSSLGIDPKPFILAIAFAGCGEFITPFGYQTNLMVYGPGGYKFIDYVKIGVPLTIIYMLVSVLVLSYMYNLY